MASVKACVRPCLISAPYTGRLNAMTLPLAGRLSDAIGAVLRRLPFSDYQKTRLWATSLRRPIGPTQAWPIYRSLEIIALALSRPYGYGELVPEQGRSYSLLEFGVANGFTLHMVAHFRDVLARKYGLSVPLPIVGFDTFESLPAPRAGDEALPYRAGDIPSELAAVQRSFSAFRDVSFAKGLFTDTLPQWIPFLTEHPPLFVSIDCDYYSSTIDVFDHLIGQHRLPHGACLYFDDVSTNFYSDKSGELKAIREVNAGRYGDHIQLVEYPIWVETREIRHYRQLYRFFDGEQAECQQQTVREARPLWHLPSPGRTSPL